MAFNLKKLASNYFRKKKPFGIVTDFLFVILVVLLIIPGTRKDVAAFFIRMTSLPASTLDADEQFAISATAKAWPLYDLKGNAVRFEELNSKPVFLNIWATWCPPCIAELPGIEDLYENYGSDVNFILVSNESPETVLKFIKKHGYNELPFYLSNHVPPEFSSQSIPTTFIVNKQGDVLVKKKGAARWNAGRTEKLLEQLIKE